MSAVDSYNYINSILYGEMTTLIEGIKQVHANVRITSYGPDATKYKLKRLCDKNENPNCAVIRDSLSPNQYGRSRLYD